MDKRQQKIEEQKAFHAQEVIRIRRELNSLGNEFAHNGIVRFVLLSRIEQERKLSIYPI